MNIMNMQMYVHNISRWTIYTNYIDLKTHVNAHMHKNWKNSMAYVEQLRGEIIWRSLF